MIFIIAKILLLLAFGFSFLNVIKFKGDWMESLGLSFLIGTGLMTVIYFVLAWFTDRVFVIEFWNLVVLLTLTLFAIRLPHFEIKRFKIDRSVIIPNLVPVFCWLAILIIFTASIIYTIYTPIYTVDSLALFDFRSKVMFLSQRLSEIKTIDSWYSFPMFTSMIGLIWRYVGIENPGSYFPLMYLSFTMIFYSISKSIVDKRIASIGTLFMYTTPITLWGSQMGVMTNTSYTIFLSLSIIYLYKILVSKNRYFYNVAIAAILLGLSTWTRATEPIWVVPLLLAVVVLIIYKKIRWLLAFTLIFLVIRTIWPTFTEQPVTPISLATKIVVDKAIQHQADPYGFYPVLSYTIHSMALMIPQTLGLVLYLFGFTLISDIFFKKFEITQKYFIFSIFGILGIIFLGSLFYVLNFHITLHIYNDSLSRLLGTLTPLMWFYITASRLWAKTGSLLKLRLK